METEFNVEQENHREKSKKHLKNLYDLAVQTMKNTMDLLDRENALSKSNIMNEWKAYVQKIDTLIEEACKKSVKNTLNELYKSLNINDDSKSNPTPIFKIGVELYIPPPSKKYTAVKKIVFNPTTDSLRNTLQVLASEIIHVFTAIPRLTKTMREERRLVEKKRQEENDAKGEGQFGMGQKQVNKDVKQDPGQERDERVREKAEKEYQKVIGSDKEIRLLTEKIINGIDKNLVKLHKLLELWRTTEYL